MRDRIYRIVDTNGRVHSGCNNTSGWYSTLGGAKAQISREKAQARRYGHDPAVMRIQQSDIVWGDVIVLDPPE